MTTKFFRSMGYQIFLCMGLPSHTFRAYELREKTTATGVIALKNEKKWRNSENPLFYNASLDLLCYINIFEHYFRVFRNGNLTGKIDHVCHYE